MRKTIIGYTGTQLGMTRLQQRRVVQLLKQLKPVEVRHGDCIGGDAQFHELVRKHRSKAQIVVHPPKLSHKRAWCKGDVILPTEDYIDRNHSVVDASDVVFATPKEFTEQLRSGTWATYRYAINSGKTVYLILPDGTYTII